MALGVSDVVRLSAVFNAGTPAIEICTFDVVINDAGSGGNTGFREDAQEWLGAIFTTLTAYILTGTTGSEVDFYHRTGTEALPPITWTDAPDFLGDGEALPWQTSAVAIFRTEHRGTRGRKFLPTMNEAANSGGRPVVDVKTDVEDFIDEAIGEFTGGNGWQFQQVVWSEKDSTAYLITEGFCSPEWGVQRRRRPGVGI